MALGRFEGFILAVCLAEQGLGRSKMEEQFSSKRLMSVVLSVVVLEV